MEFTSGIPNKPQVSELQGTIEQQDPNYTNSCQKMMLAAINTSVSDKELADMLIWDFKPDFRPENILLTLNTIASIQPSRVGNGYSRSDSLIRARSLIINNNIGEIEDAFSTNDPTLRDVILKIFSQQLEYGLGEDIDGELEFFLRHSKDGIIDYVDFPIILLRKGMTYHQYREANPDKADHTWKLREGYFNWAKDLYEKGDTPRQKGIALRAISYAATEDMDFPRQYLADKITAMGVDGEFAISAWEETYAGDIERRSKFIVNNFVTMINFETDTPGMCKTLYEEFGIVDFSRYSDEALETQYDNRNKNVPYGVLIFPQGDLNGAFSTMMPQIDELQYSLRQQGYELRIYEASSRKEVMEALISAHKRYGKRNKLSFAVIGGHGTQGNIRFKEGEINKTDFVKRQDLENHRAKRLKELFIDNPNIVLISCSTGAEAGLGSSISKLGAYVIAPEKDTALKSIRAIRNPEGQLSFDVEFSESPTRVHFNGKSDVA